MLELEKNGMVKSPQVIAERRLAIEKAPLDKIKGIIVHQTGGATARSSLDSYQRTGANGAHLLIDKDGTIYQTASLYRQTWHVGKLRARCLVEHRCTPVETKALSRFNPSAENTREQEKAVPERYPANSDSIGIELVGMPDAKGVYEPVTTAQNTALQWLVRELVATFGIALSEVFRHPDVSRKTPSEAATAQW